MKAPKNRTWATQTDTNGAKDKTEFDRRIILLDPCHHANFVLTLTQIPQPMQSSSLIYAILSVGVTSMHSFPILTTGHDFLHSCRHLLGLHLSALTMAILVSLSDAMMDGEK